MGTVWVRCAASVDRGGSSSRSGGRVRGALAVLAGHVLKLVKILVLFRKVPVRGTILVEVLYPILGTILGVQVLNYHA